MIIHDHICRTKSILPEQELLPAQSSFRTVFSSDSLKSEFVKFLKTIFYQLDDKKVLQEMNKILADPAKTDKEVYEELVLHIDEMRNRFPALFSQLKALSVLQKGMGLQAASLMKDFRKEEFHNYLEIYFRRYLKTIQKTAALPLDGKIFAACDFPYNKSLKEKLEAGALLSSYPYQEHVPLNDPDCDSPDTQPEKTHKPIGNEVPNNEIDMISCLGGLHHIPKEKVGAFIDSMASKLRPGGVLLVRDHDVTSGDLSAIVFVVHSFVNAANQVPWSVENKEIREFHSAEYWTKLLEAHNFTRISSDNLILQDDPTQNGMMAFIKAPKTLEELQTAARYRNDCVRPADGTRATWIEWGNVRYSKQFAEFIQNRHSYAFDFIGHLRQHWNYFTQYLTESRKDLPLQKILFSDNFAMNLFILISTAFQCGVGYISSLPSILAARVQHGVDWRNATDLTTLEKYQAQVEKEYSTFIDHTPFYMFPYLDKIKGLWTAILHSNESPWIKSVSTIKAFFSTLGYAATAAVCAPVRAMYTDNGQAIEPDMVSILIHDPENQFKTGEKEIANEWHKIKVVYETQDHYKLLLVPRYRLFTELCKELALNENVKLLEIGSQSKITVDVLFKKDEATPMPVKEAKVLYEMEKLQDAEGRRYVTYEVQVSALAKFESAIGPSRIEYVHE